MPYETEFSSPIVSMDGIRIMNETYAWSYVVLSFVIFSVALAVIRNLYRNVTGRKNIKKEFKRRFKRAIGNDIEGEQRDSFMGNQGGPEYNPPHNTNEEESKSGDGEGSHKKGYLAGLKESAKGAYHKVKGNKPDGD